MTQMSRVTFVCFPLFVRGLKGNRATSVKVAVNYGWLCGNTVLDENDELSLIGHIGNLLTVIHLKMI